MLWMLVILIALSVAAFLLWLSGIRHVKFIK